MISIILKGKVRSSVIAADVDQNAVVDEKEATLVSVAEALATEMPLWEACSRFCRAEMGSEGRQLWRMFGMSACEEPSVCERTRESR
jgi:hypothetical protein